MLGLKHVGGTDVYNIIVYLIQLCEFGLICSS